MSAVLRPKFGEGQVLGAGDLNAQVDYERLGSVLHERTEHLWGVAQGLTLQTIPQSLNGKNYVDVNLLPGRAVDRLGRSLVVTEPLPLDANDFQMVTKSPDDKFPVFLQAIELPRSGSGQPGKCSTNLTTRIEEGVQISFGTPGSELSVIDQEAAAVDAGFGTPALNDKVLVGWVTWSKDQGKFTGVTTSSNGRGIRYVGVVASEVVGGGDSIALRTRPGGSRFALTIAEDSTGGCELRFGKQDGQGPVAPSFSVDDKGNLTYSGVLSPAPVSKTLAESGVTFDGLRLPLPSGVTEEQVASGIVRLHVVLTPVVQAPAAGTIPIVVECEVDMANGRRVLCKLRTYNVPAGTIKEESPWACNYLIVASGK